MRPSCCIIGRFTQAEDSRHMCRRNQRTHALVLMGVVALILATNATLVARDSHLTAFERDCPACRVSSTFVAEQCVPLDITAPVNVVWNPLPEDTIENSDPLPVTRRTRAPPV